MSEKLERLLGEVEARAERGHVKEFIGSFDALVHGRIVTEIDAEFLKTAREDSQKLCRIVRALMKKIEGLKEIRQNEEATHITNRAGYDAALRLLYEADMALAAELGKDVRDAER